MLTKSVAVSDAPGTAAKGRYDAAAHRSARAMPAAPENVRVTARAAINARERPVVMLLDSLGGARFLPGTYQGTPADVARNFMSGAMFRHSAMNVDMKSSASTFELSPRIRLMTTWRSKPFV